MQKVELKIRPHHLLCIANFVGKGYNDEFVANLKNIIKRLNNDECFEVVNDLDSICITCPKQNGKVCDQQFKVAKLDHKSQELLAVAIGDILSWGQVRHLIKAKLDKQNFSIICSECEWVSLCEKSAI